MKVKIVYEFKDGPWGGANQFLAALKKQFVEMGVYTEDDNQADVFLINSINAFHDYKNVLSLRKKYKNKLFVHRVDGPVFLIRGGDKYIDRGIFCINNRLADATIYQTNWSKQKCIEQGMKDNTFNTTICNGSNNDIFNCQEKVNFPERKKRIIATSWSSNWNKGFEFYQFLDQNLDTNKYEFMFVGNSPIEFQNGMLHPPVESRKLAELLKNSDIYVTASKNDPCSNSLIEALNCGLPAAVYNDGGHPEILGKGGETFSTKEEMLKAIDKIAEHLTEYKEKIVANDIKEVAEKYLEFFMAASEIEIKKKNNRDILAAYLTISVLKVKPIIQKYFFKIVALLRVGNKKKEKYGRER